MSGEGAEREALSPVGAALATAMAARAARVSRILSTPASTTFFLDRAPGVAAGEQMLFELLSEHRSARPFPNAFPDPPEVPRGPGARGGRRP